MMVLRWMEGSTVKRGEVVRMEFDYPKQECTVVIKGEPAGTMLKLQIPDLLDAYWIR